MPKSRPPTQKQIRQLLLESLFNPREKSPLSLILEIAEGSPKVLSSHALLLIRESQEAVMQEITLEKLTKAISLLVSAKQSILAMCPKFSEIDKGLVDLTGVQSGRVACGMSIDDTCASDTCTRPLEHTGQCN